LKPDFFNAANILKCRYIPILLALSICLAISTSLSAQDEAAADSLVADSLVQANTPLPPTNIAAQDQPDDGGGAITVTWGASPDDVKGGKVKLYKIFRAEFDDGQPGEFAEVGDVPAGKAEYSNEDGNTTDDVRYLYKVTAVNRMYDESGSLVEYSSDSQQAGPVTSSAQWFHMPRINVLVAVILLSFFIVYFIQKAKTGKELYIRRIAGMEAVDEAVGRATEMGRKIFYITGLGDMDNMQTIASMTILGRVAELAAQYETYIDVPVCRSLVMVTGREVVKESYSKAGRPDAFKPDQVHYLTDDQFGYAAAVDGMFFAESLILAETGNSIGAIQIAGTAMPAQLPFFVAACDYTLIGEELFAASAYLSKEPKLLGSLKGQDIGKGVILIALIIGVLLETFGIWQLSRLFLVK
jgi:hypothetical protein